MMSEHVTIKDLDRYLSGELTPSELLAFDSHVGACEACRSTMLDHSEVKGSAWALENALSARMPGHLTYEEFESFVDDTLTGTALSRVQDHLGACSECRDEVDHLKEFARPAAVEISYTTGQSTGWMGQLTEALSARRWALASAFGVVAVFAVSVWFLLQRSQSTDQPLLVGVTQNENTNAAVPVEQSPANTEIAVDVTPEPILTVALKDGGTEVGLDAGGTLIGYDGLSAAQSELLRSAMRSGNVTIGPEVKELAPDSGRRMGDSLPAGAETIRVVSPIGKIVDTDRQTFVWKPLEGAESYRVDVFDINYRKVASSGDLRVTRWATELPRGKTFVWQVTGIKDGAEIRSTAASSTEARFRTLDLARSREIASIKRRYPNSHLLFGLAYAEAGMIEEARSEFELLASENPKSPIPARLMKQLDKYSPGK